MSDAARLGFATRADYARARRAELDQALHLLRVTPRRLAYDIPDQQAIDRIDELIDRLAQDLAGMAAVLTHPYEGCHPDHDAAALAVQVTAERIAALGGTAPAIVEFACYHHHEGERRFGHFWPDAEHPEYARALDVEDALRVNRAVAAHRTQSAVIGTWRPDAERWRAGPGYDFKKPPPPGESLYDRFGWTITSARWRDRARQELSAWA